MRGRGHGNPGIVKGGFQLLGKVEAPVATETGWASRLTRPPERFRRRWLGVLALTVSTLAGVTACERASDPVDPTPGRSAVAIQVVSGGGQRAFTGAPLREPIVFRALGADGLPVAGAVMNFVSTAGSGWVEPERAIANQDGDVAVAWTIGPAAGVQTLLISTGLAATAINAYAIDLGDRARRALRAAHRRRDRDHSRRLGRPRRLARRGDGGTRRAVRRRTIRRRRCGWCRTGSARCATSGRSSRPTPRPRGASPC